MHPHYKTVVIPLTVWADQDTNESEMIVSILDKNKKIIIQKAYLHEEIKNTNKDLAGLPYFKIEIPEDDILKISATDQNLMIAIPEVKIVNATKKVPHKKESRYEINI